MNFFTHKEQFHTFRKAFAAAQNDKRARKSIEQIEIKRYNYETNKHEPATIKVKTSGWLTSAHFLMYNLIAGRDYYAGFTPKTKETFITNSGDPDQGLLGALQQLHSIVERAKALTDEKTIKVPSWRQKDKRVYIDEYVKDAQSIVNRFVEPFNGAITHVDIARLQVPALSRITPRSTQELAQMTKPITYWKLIGRSIVDQTPMSGAVLSQGPINVTPPAKKGFFARVFGG